MKTVVWVSLVACLTTAPQASAQNDSAAVALAKEFQRIDSLASPSRELEFAKFSLNLASQEGTHEKRWLGTVDAYLLEVLKKPGPSTRNSDILDIVFADDVGMRPWYVPFVDRFSKDWDLRARPKSNQLRLRILLEALLHLKTHQPEKYPAQLQLYVGRGLLDPVNAQLIIQLVSYSFFFNREDFARRFSNLEWDWLDQPAHRSQVFKNPNFRARGIEVLVPELFPNHTLADFIATEPDSFRRTKWSTLIAETAVPRNDGERFVFSFFSARPEWPSELRPSDLAKLRGHVLSDFIPKPEFEAFVKSPLAQAWFPDSPYNDAITLADVGLQWLPGSSPQQRVRLMQRISESKAAFLDRMGSRLLASPVVLLNHLANDQFFVSDANSFEKSHYPFNSALRRIWAIEFIVQNAPEVAGWSFETDPKTLCVREPSRNWSFAFEKLEMHTYFWHPEIQDALTHLLSAAQNRGANTRLTPR